jgi:hypothetical protein
MLFGAKCWPTKRHVQQLSVAEMHMLRLFFGHTRDCVWNDNIRERLGVSPVEEKFMQHRVRWFGHVQWRPTKASVHSGVISRADNRKRQRKTKLDMCGVCEERFKGL